MAYKIFYIDDLETESRKKDLEKNLRALLNESVEKLELVTKQELERQKIALNLANQRLAALQQQMSTLEKMVQDQK